MTYEMVCIGDELLEGRIRDVNAANLGRVLDGKLRRVQIVSDDINDIIGALKFTTSDVVIVSGGLGPTEDDRTREAAARFAGVDLYSDADCEAAIRARLAARGRTFTDNNLRQAMFPTGARILPSDVGTAPGFVVEQGSRQFFFFPGVPTECSWFVARHVVPTLGERPDSEQVLTFFGLGESALESTITETVETAPSRGAKVGFCAQFPVIEVKFTGPAAWVATAREEVLARLRPYYVGEVAEGLAGRVGRLLKARGATVTTAESCTAGGIAAMITDVSGSSAWFDRAYVTYANAAKIEELGVSAETLESVGAVSEAVVRQMAEGARRRAVATYALAVSGIAGPGGGTPEKPVGTVHFALAGPDHVEHRVEVFRGRDRADVRVLTAYTALQMLLTELERECA